MILRAFYKEQTYEKQVVSFKPALQNGHNAGMVKTFFVMFLLEASFIKTIIVGGGKVGQSLAQQLLLEEYDVTIVDRSSRVVEQARTTLDIIGIVGNGAAYPVLESAGAKDADLLIALTASDETNMLCCLTAHQLGAKHTIARVRSPEYYDQLFFLKECLGLSMAVNPELAAAEEITRILRFPSATKVEIFARGRVELVSYHVTESNGLCGTILSDLPHKTGIKVLICVVEHGDNVVIPSGNYRIAADDTLYFTGAPEQIVAAFRKLGLLTERVQNVLIIGGGRISYYLATQLAKDKIHVKIIEKDAARAVELASLLPKANVLQGDASNHELLMEEGLNRQDAFVALTGLDEGNILSSIYAHHLRVPKVIAKVNNDNLVSLIHDGGLESIISPKRITTSQILRFARALSAGRDREDILALYQIVGGRVEVMEFRAASAAYCDMPLKTLPIRPNILIACIVRQGKTIIPNGDDVIQQDDSVLVVTAGQRLIRLADILQGNV